MNVDFIEQLKLNNISFKLDELLAPYTTWKIGGPADILVIIESIDAIKTVLALVKQHKIEYTILGAGSNVLISDQGLRGVTLINKINSLTINGILEKQSVTNNQSNTIEARLEQLDTKNYYSFAELDYDESDKERISITVGSGYYLPQLINILIQKEITGLQWFAGIPGTIGGSVYNNIHGGSHYISEYIESVTVLTPELDIKKYPKTEIKFDYDYSSFHDSQDIILSVDLSLFLGDKHKALQTAMAWAQKKRLQPYRSAGCCFKNLTAQDIQEYNIPSSSWGYIIDNILHLKGKQIGDAIISPNHAAFIENLGKARASDVIALLDNIYSEAAAKVGITPDPEIFFLGFDKDIVAKYVKSYSNS